MIQNIADRYSLDEPLGKGSIGSSWRGRERGASGFSRAVIVHKLHADFAASDRFMETLTKSGGSLMDRPHPNIQGVVDVVRTGVDAYLVVDAIDGPSMKAWVEACHEQGHPAPWAPLLSIAAHVLHGLHSLHHRPRPLVHGGIDTTCIRLDRSGVPVLTRFGIAEACDASGVGAESLRVRVPEKTVAPSADVFAVGLLLYTVLAGSSDTAVLPDDLRKRLMAGKPVDLNLVRDDIPAVVLGAVERALQANPRDRFASALDMARSLDLILRSLAEITDAAALAKHLEQVLPMQSKKPKPKMGLSPEETDQLDLVDLRRLRIDE